VESSCETEPKRESVEICMRYNVAVGEVFHVNVVAGGTPVAPLAGRRREGGGGGATTVVKSHVVEYVPDPPAPFPLTRQ
jgi:hypothetical protein